MLVVGFSSVKKVITFPDTVSPRRQLLERESGICVCNSCLAEGPVQRRQRFNEFLNEIMNESNGGK